MKLKRFIAKAVRLAGGGSRCFWQRRVILRARPVEVNVQLRQNGLLTGEVLREMPEQSDAEKHKENAK